jgi:predicted Ser/Thr protein kinase
VKELAPGTVIAGLRVESLVGRGGMGVVYRATDVRLDRPVALKLIADDRASDDAFRERFEREARLTASLDHPNVIPVYAAGEEDGALFLAMRYVAGTDLHELLRRDGRLDAARAADIVRQVAEALDAAHAAGLVHRDVKPANVLLSGSHVYLSDFGLTRAVADEARLTDTDERLGTVDFMAPEHLRGQRTDARSDIYALGCVLFTALTGTPPFHKPTAMATISAHLEDPVPRASQRAAVPDEVDDVIGRALAKDPAERFQSAGDLGRAAVAAAAGKAPDAPDRSVARGEAAPDLAATRRLSEPGSSATVALPGKPHGPAIPPARRDRAAPVPTATLERRGGRRDRLRAGLLAAGLVVLAAAAVATAVVLLVGGSDEGSLSSGEIARTARSFASAYGREDRRALNALLAPNVERISPSDLQRGRRAVLAEYGRQFQANVTREYRLDGLEATGGSAGRASARFTVERANRPPITGRVVLGVERIGGRPRIRLIATEPRS